MPRSSAALLSLLLVAACAGGDESKAEANIESSAGDSAPVSGAPAAAPAGAFLDPEQASREELMALPGFDAGLADSLLAKRPFTDMRDVDRVLAGKLSEEQRDSVYTRLWKPLDLNTASDEEILLIPGVGEKMEHEFKEYRPWQNLEHFRREIGKYVDEAEVARLEKYVRIGAQ